jgi:hypothetical protein
MVCTQFDRASFRSPFRSSLSTCHLDRAPVEMALFLVELTAWPRELLGIQNTSFFEPHKLAACLKARASLSAISLLPTSRLVSFQVAVPFWSLVVSSPVPDPDAFSLKLTFTALVNVR